MRAFALATMLLVLAGCAGVIDACPDGLREPGWGSGVPDPHKGP
jgi:hypothetical protein